MHFHFPQKLKTGETCNSEDHEDHKTAAGVYCPQAGSQNGNSGYMHPQMGIPARPDFDFQGEVTS